MTLPAPGPLTDAPTPAEADGARALPADDPVAGAEALVERGELAAAVDLLAAANRRRRDPAWEIRLVDLRLAGASERGRGAGREPWPPVYDDPFPGHAGSVPVVDRNALTTEVLGGAVAHHGALHVRRLFSEEQVARSIETIDGAHEVRDAVTDGTRDPDAGYRPPAVKRAMKNQVLRNMVAEQGGIWLADSPAATALALDALHDVGAVDMMTEHFGERPVFSLQKSTLRRSEPDWKLVAWHQDGSFLDADVRTMNIWVALTACGGDLPTPGLEVVPKRMGEVLPVDGVMSPHSIDYDLVAEVAADAPTVTPSFAPGDALVFDERFLHRTHLPAEMTHPRYALECWFFAPSHRTATYIPLLA